MDSRLCVHLKARLTNVPLKSAYVHLSHCSKTLSRTGNTSACSSFCQRRTKDMSCFLTSHNYSLCCVLVLYDPILVSTSWQLPLNRFSTGSHCFQLHIKSWRHTEQGVRWDLLWNPRRRPDHRVKIIIIDIIFYFGKAVFKIIHKYKHFSFNTSIIDSIWWSIVTTIMLTTSIIPRHIRIIPRRWLSKSSKFWSKWKRCNNEMGNNSFFRVVPLYIR